MAAVVRDRYHLKSLHEEIDLFDRKIAHLLKFEKFDSDEDRETAARKLTVKRETLVKTARRLAAEGVEFKPNEVPKSLRSKEELAAEAAKVAAEAAPEPAAQPVQARSGSEHAGSVMDWQASIAAYIEKRKKTRGGEVAAAQ